MSEYRGYRARRPGLARVREVRRSEIMLAIDAQAPRSRRLRGRHAGFQYQLGLSLLPQLARRRADFRDSVAAFGAALAGRVHYEDGTTFHSREAWCETAGRSSSTWKAARRVLEAGGALVTVRPGRIYYDDAGNTRNDAAVYELVLPRHIIRKIAAARRAASPRPLTRPPTGEGNPGPTEPPLHAAGPAGEGRRGPPCGRAHLRGRPAAGAVAGGPRRRPGGRLPGAGQGGADRTMRAMARPFVSAGYTADDLTWAVHHRTDGAEHWHTDPPRHPVSWLRHRLLLHVVPGDAAAFRAGTLPWHRVRPLPSRSRQLARAARAADPAGHAAGIRARLGWTDHASPGRQPPSGESRQEGTSP